jgi:hypothetical protein
MCVKQVMRVIYTDTHEEAVLAACGLHHDHVTYWFIGRTKDVPEDKQSLLLMESPYVFMYDELEC